jgi:uncharacterized membrane protein
MGKETQMQVVAALFEYEEGANTALEVIEQAKLKKALGDKAVISMDYHGKVTIKETGDMGGGKGAVIGGALGLLLPGIGTIIGTAGGALIGGLAAKLHDAGFPDDQLKALGGQLQPNSSLLLAVVGEEHLEEVEAKLRSINGKVIKEGLTQDAVDQLSLADLASQGVERSSVLAAATAESAEPEPPAAGQGFALAGEDVLR